MRKSIDFSQPLFKLIANPLIVPGRLPLLWIKEFEIMGTLMARFTSDNAKYP